MLFIQPEAKREVIERKAQLDWMEVETTRLSSTFVLFFFCPNFMFGLVFVYQSEKSLVELH